MKKILITFLFFILCFSACGKKDSSSSSGLDFLNSDEKDEASELIKSANNDLKKVKVIYNNNQKRVDDELIPALTAKDLAKAQEITNDLVIQINSGLVSADDAVKKIKDAENMNINDTYQNYLRLKREALEKQIEAFELRRQVAQVMSKSLGNTDPSQATQAQSIFKEKELQFFDLMEQGKGLSQEANQIYRDSLTKK